MPGCTRGREVLSPAMGEPPPPCLSVVMPCFNEEDTVEEALRRVLASPWTAEVIAVDDGSTDATGKLIEGLIDGLADERTDALDDESAHERAARPGRPSVTLLVEPVNRGKGAALRRGIAAATAPFVVIQDADLEYDPVDYATLLGPLLDGRADAVFGSRFLADRPHRVLYYWHYVGNRVLTTMSNMLTNLNLSDMETCYKAFRREVIQGITLEEDRFGFEPEITAKVAAGGWRVYEVGVGYDGRTYAEGKKIGWRDGVWAMWCIVRYGAASRRR